jgi:hypothetical protein
MAHLIRCLTKGIDAIHAVGVIHRDISPGNVLCCGFGESEIFKIADFGVARPEGLVGTFAKVPMGTPGYAAPEIVRRDDALIGKATDLFGIGCLIFFALTGEHLFDVRSLIQGLVLSEKAERRSILDGAHLHPDLRSLPAVCREIDSVLALATESNPGHRPPTGELMRRALMMSWGSDKRKLRASKGRVASVAERDDMPASTGWSWNVLHAPGDQRLVRSVAWEGDGSALVVTSHGLEFFNGTHWLPAVATGVPAADQIHFVQRVDAGLWLLGGADATLAQYAAEGVKRLVRGNDVGVSYTHASGTQDRVVVGIRADSAPTLHAALNREWLAPVVLDGKASVAAIARLGEDRFLIVGRNTDNSGFASVYVPSAGTVSEIGRSPQGAYLTCHAQPDIGMGLVGGVGGSTLVVMGDQTRISEVPGGPLISAAAVDIDGNAWIASQGALWHQRISKNGGVWRRAWETPEWNLPFVSVFADVGHVIAMTVDGGIVEGRAVSRG